MKNSLFYLCRAVLITTILYGCNYKYDKITETESGQTQTDSIGAKPGETETDTKATIVGFDKINSEILIPKCLNCHSAGKRSPTLVTYEDIKNNLAAIENAVLIEKSMPKAGPLEANLQSLLKKWLDDGAPLEENVPSVAPTGQTATTTPPPEIKPQVEEEIPRPVTFEYLKQKVLQQKCISCHSQAAYEEEGRLPLEAYEDLMFMAEDGMRTVGDILAPITIGGYMTGEGMIIEPDRLMPPAKKPQLTSQEKLIILLWVNDGKINKIQ
jgi:uncharacterized membrane protein